MPALPLIQAENITEALFNLIIIISISLLNASEHILSTSSIKTILLMLQAFSSSTDSGLGYQFWDPLTAALKQRIKPLLHCLQTQVFLHDLHIHFTVDKVLVLCVRKLQLKSTLDYSMQNCPCHWIFNTLFYSSCSSVYI